VDLAPSPGSILVGATSAITVTATNKGPDAETAAQVTDPIGGAVKYASSTATAGSYNAGTRGVDHRGVGGGTDRDLDDHRHRGDTGQRDAASGGGQADGVAATVARVGSTSDKPPIFQQVNQGYGVAGIDSCSAAGAPQPPLDLAARPPTSPAQR